MSRTFTEAPSRSDYRVIFDSALTTYKKKTGKDLTSDPLLCRFEACHSPDTILAIFQTQILGPGQLRSGGDKLLTWLNPTINVLSAFSSAIGGSVGQAYPPVGVIFTGIGVLLSAAKAVSSSRDFLLGLFERIENIFRRLEIYIEVPRTSGMTDVIVKVMVEVLCILSIATKEIHQHRAKTFLKKLVGRTDIEDALQRLELVTLEEARMAAAESLKAIHGVGFNVQDTLKAIEDRMRGMEGMLQGVGDRLQGVDDRGKNSGDRIINGVEKAGLQMPKDLGAVATESTEGLRTAQRIDFQVQRVQDIQEDVRNEEIDINNVRNTVQDIGTLSEHGADQNATNNVRSTPLHLAASHGQLATVRLLVEHGADVHVQNKDGWTPLHEAAARGYFDVAQLLLKHGASVHVQNKDGWTPLHEATSRGYLDVMRLLLEHGADRGATNNVDSTPLHLAASYGQLAAARLLIDHGADVHVQNKDGWTTLQEATSRGYLDIMKLLLEHGADLDAANNVHSTPLHLAASYGQLAAVRLLIDHGADVHVQNRDGWTPLHEAASRGYLDPARLLLEHGATVQVQNKDGWTPLHEATSRGHIDVARLLLEHGAT